MGNARASVADTVSMPFRAEGGATEWDAGATDKPSRTGDRPAIAFPESPVRFGRKAVPGAALDSQNEPKARGEPWRGIVWHRNRAKFRELLSIQEHSRGTGEAIREVTP
jgi:hypothetical protein